MSLTLYQMLVRQYHDSDLAQLRAIHAAQGFDYPLPDLNNPLFVTKLVLTEEPSLVVAQPCPERSRRNAAPAQNDEHGGTGLREGKNKPSSGSSRATSHDSRVTIIGAAFLRLTAEAYLLLDPRAGTPRQRWQALLALHNAAERDAWRRGLEDVHAWLPPPIAKRFGKRLARLGWLRDDTWTPYCKPLRAGD